MGNMTVYGIPRGLFYWQHKTLWKTFFNELQIQYMCSAKTTTKIVNLGIKYSEDESCFAYKILFGHIMDLIDKVDIIFLPSYMSMIQNFISCPKFAGIADVIRSLDIEKKPKIYSPIIDLNKRDLNSTLMKIGLQIKKSKKKVKIAVQSAINKAHIEKTNQHNKFRELMEQENKKVIIFGHRYILEDDFINFRICYKLKKMGIIPIPIHYIPHKNHNFEFNWDFVAEEISKLLSLDTKKISGIIQLSSFNCGPDSIISEYLISFAHKKNLPLLSLLLDEHTGEVGFNTRIEAFFDTLTSFNFF